ncbi:hypothetical protein N0V88_003194 [Collariella sp. IMI 366227]|nr:hypothetical protein N0V88_003194 [Collariella sp. IMI 366227]
MMDDDENNEIVKDIQSTAYAKFYAYLFKELPVCWRQLYTDASILKFALLFMSWPIASTDVEEHKDKATVEKHLDEMIKTLDLTLILSGAAGEKRGRQWINKTFALLEEVWHSSLPQPSGDSRTEASEERPTKRHKTLAEPAHSTWDNAPSFSAHEPFTPPVTRPIKRVHYISLEDFQTSTWPARTTHPWSKPSYLLSRTFHGRRLVPVELGRSYVDAGWGQKILPFGDFLTTYITSSHHHKAQQNRLSSPTPLLTPPPHPPFRHPHPPTSATPPHRPIHFLRKSART